MKKYKVKYVEVFSSVVHHKKSGVSDDEHCVDVKVLRRVHVAVVTW